MYMGSADLMPRNLYNRVELVVPAESERVREELLDILERGFDDETNNWDLQPDGRWVRRQAQGESPRSLQRELIERAHARVSEAI